MALRSNTKERKLEFVSDLRILRTISPSVTIEQLAEVLERDPQTIDNWVSGAHLPLGDRKLRAILERRYPVYGPFSEEWKRLTPQQRRLRIDRAIRGEPDSAVATAGNGHDVPTPPPPAMAATTPGREYWTQGYEKGFEAGFAAGRRS